MFVLTQSRVKRETGLSLLKAGFEPAQSLSSGLVE